MPLRCFCTSDYEDYVCGCSKHWLKKSKKTEVRLCEKHKKWYQDFADSMKKADKTLFGPQMQDALACDSVEKAFSHIHRRDLVDYELVEEFTDLM